MIIENRFSPNYSKKLRKFKDIKFIILHYTGMQSKIESVKRLLSPKHKVSCHYLIDRKGNILRMVDDKKIAWHAGKSKWKNFNNLNKYSIGIELVNKGHKLGYQNFTDMQIKELIKLSLKLKRKYKIRNTNILGHSDIAPTRKKDPGEKFPWKKLYKNNLGMWFPSLKGNVKIVNIKNMRKFLLKNLYKIGYRYINTKRGEMSAISAFQQRFLSIKPRGKIDQKTYIISHLLAQKYKN